jgi:hypothetical protein
MKSAGPGGFCLNGRICWLDEPEPRTAKKHGFMPNPSAKQRSGELCDRPRLADGFWYRVEKIVGTFGTPREHSVEPVVKFWLENQNPS